MPLYVKLVGDTTIAGRYVGYGTQIVNQLEVSGQKTSYVTLSDVAILASVIGTQKHLRIEGISATSACSLYLESGHVKYGQFHHNRPNASDPATIYEGATSPSAHLFGTISLPAGGTDYSKATVKMPVSVDAPVAYDMFGSAASMPFKSGEHSPKSFFKAPRLNESVPSLDPYEATEGSGIAGTWPICNALEKKKELVAKVSPSLYSGKMRLFVQALFGAALDVFSSQKLEVYEAQGQPPKLKMNGVVLDFSDSIFTSDDGSYWLIQLGTLVTVTRIKLTACGKALSAWLIKNPSGNRKAQSEYEAYIFAGATLDKGFMFTLANIPAITPIAYGWKFNWSGSEASCISVVGKGTGHNTWWEATRQRVTLSRDSKREFRNEQAALTELQKERARWSMVSSDTSVSDAFNFPWGVVFVWVPDYSDFSHTRKSGVDPAVTGPTGTIGSVYGWYDTNDVFVTADFNHGISANDNFSSHDSFPPGQYVYDGLSCIYSTRTATTISHGFTVAGTYKGSVLYSSNYSEGSFSAIANTPSTSIGYEAAWDANNDQTVYWGGAISIGIPTNASWTSTHGGIFPTGLGTTDSATQAAIGGILNANDSNPGWTGGWDQVIETASKGIYSKNLVGGTELRNGAIALVVPFYDSEAVYVYSSNSHTKTPTSQATGSGLISTADGFSGLYIAVWGISYGGGTERCIARFPSWASASMCGTTSTTITTPAIDETVIEGACFKKDGSVPAILDTGTSMFTPGALNDRYAGGNYCFTYTSAVYNYVNGSNVAPSHADFTYNTGTFIGWF